MHHDEIKPFGAMSISIPALVGRLVGLLLLVAIALVGLTFMWCCTSIDGATISWFLYVHFCLFDLQHPTCLLIPFFSLQVLGASLIVPPKQFGVGALKKFKLV